jgi:hypothetical protein
MKCHTTLPMISTIYLSSPEAARSSFIQASRELESEAWALRAKRKTPWNDDTERQVVAREDRSPSHYPQDPRNNVSQPIIRNGDDRGPRRGQVSQQSNYHVYDAGPTRQAITMDPPGALGAGLRRDNVMIASTPIAETDVLHPLPERKRRMDLHHQEVHVLARSRVATIEKGHAQGSMCCFQATGACEQNNRTSGKGSGHRTSVPQASQTSNAQTSTSAGRDHVRLVTTQTAGYTTPPTSQSRGQKVATSRVFGSSAGSRWAQTPTGVGGETLSVGNRCSHGSIG